MALSILKLEPDTGPAIFHTDHFRQLIEDHLQILAAQENVTILDIPNHVAYSSEGDFIAILLHFNIPRQYHYVFLRVNGFSSPVEYTSDMTRLLVPSDLTIENLLKVHRIKNTSENKWG